MRYQDHIKKIEELRETYDKLSKDHHHATVQYLVRCAGAFLEAAKCLCEMRVSKEIISETDHILDATKMVDAEKKERVE